MSQSEQDRERELRDIEAERREPPVLPEFRDAPQLTMAERRGEA